MKRAVAVFGCEMRLIGRWANEARKLLPVGRFLGKRILVSPVMGLFDVS